MAYSGSWRGSDSTRDWGWDCLRELERISPWELMELEIRENLANLRLTWKPRKKRIAPVTIPIRIRYNKTFTGLRFRIGGGSKK